MAPGPSSSPNSIYVNWDDASHQLTSARRWRATSRPPREGPFVMIYDSTGTGAAQDGERPAGLDPGQPRPVHLRHAADFTGSAFVRHICYTATGGHEQFMGDFDQALFNKQPAACWQALNEIEPSLWRDGQTYPENRARMIDLFANGEVAFDMAYNPAEASSLLAQAAARKQQRTFVFNEGTIANTHYVAIPYNSPHKAAGHRHSRLPALARSPLQQGRPGRLGRPAGDRPGAAAGRVAAALRRLPARPGHAFRRRTRRPPPPRAATLAGSHRAGLAGQRLAALARPTCSTLSEVPGT